LRYFSTLRSSSGIARMTTTPDCGLTTRFRPGPVPISARSANVISFQKSLCETIDTRLASKEAVAMDTQAERAQRRWVPAPAFRMRRPCGCGRAPAPLCVPEIAPELTRTSLRPERRPIR